MINLEMNHYLYFKKLKKILLSFDEEIKLINLAKNGNYQAKESLISAHSQLILNMAKSFKNDKVPLEDLFQEGIIGLLTAIKRFDPLIGFKFSTYAAHWVKQAMLENIFSSLRPIRIPAYISRILWKTEKLRKNHLKVYGKEPTYEQLSTALNVSIEKLRAYIKLSNEILSLDFWINYEEHFDQTYLIKDVISDTPESIFFRSTMFYELQEIINQLTEREKRIIYFRYNTHEKNSHQLRSSLAKELNLTRERVRQIELGLMKKLKTMIHNKHITELFS